MRKVNFEEILQIPPYSLNREKKRVILNERLKELTLLHYENCQDYHNILDSLFFNSQADVEYEAIPFLPVRLFKELELKSVADGEIIKIMTSSGTTGQKVAKIYLDKITAIYQQKVLIKIVSAFTQVSRMPMIIVDCPSVIKNRDIFSARGAGILGFSLFGRQKIYAFNDNMELDIDELQEFLKKYAGQEIFLFGFTFIVWQHFYKELCRLKKEGICLNLENGILIHGGGWKKLVSEAVSREEFKQALQSVCGIQRVHDYYGMVEQTGCIAMECEFGHLHTSNFSDIFVRNPIDFSLCKNGEEGVVQVVSTLPVSYPGHSLLTEDMGTILGEDDCPCGKMGKYFMISGRMKRAEIRGCSDTYGQDFE